MRALEEELYKTKENEYKVNDECESNSEALNNLNNNLATFNKVNNALTNKIDRLNEEKSILKSFHESNINQLEDIICEKEEDCNNIQHDLKSTNKNQIIVSKPVKSHKNN